MIINNILSIDEKFQRSINLRYDLKDINKINNYVPTISSLHILSSYIDDFMNDYSHKSTVLVGPYGKGKSHMLLMLTALFSYYDDSLSIDNLISKIGSIDHALSEKLMNIRNNKIKLLPIIVSNTQRDFNQAILLALLESLNRENITDIVPKTYYSEILKTLEMWKKDYQDVYEKFLRYIDDISDFKKKLKKCDKQTYHQFLEIHKEILAGTEYNPMVDMEITTILESINGELIEKHNYNGLIIIFDEFSKYLESSDDNTITNEIKIIQDICELSNASQKNKIFSIFVMHKKIQEYNNELTNKVKNAYKGIEGRIQYKEFYISPKNNYELIGNVLKKNEKFEDFKTRFGYKMIQKSTNDLPVFTSLFTSDELEKIVVENCFPMTPIGAYLLLKLSEKIGQNERSIFNFLSTNEEKGLLSILNKMHNEIEFVTADVVYDYFALLIHENKAEYNMYQINLKLQDALLKLKNVRTDNVDVLVKYLKSLALIHMNNDFDIVEATNTTLQNALALNAGEIQIIHDKLVELNIIGDKKRKIIFKSDFSFALEQNVNDLSKKIYNKTLTEFLNDVERKKYMISRRYNNEFKMTRYFEKKYMSYDILKSLTNFNYLFDENFSDGKIIYLMLNEAEYDVRVTNVHPKTIFVKVKITKKLDVYKNKFLAIEELLKKETEEIIIEEYINMKNDLLDDLEEELSKGMFENACYNQVITMKNTINHCSLKQFDSELYSMLKYNYTKTPIINYELINKNNVFGAYKKARENVIEEFLKGDVSKFKDGTSAEASLYRATLYNKGFDRSDKDADVTLLSIINLISNMLIDTNGEKTSFKTIYSKLQESPYGMRKGVIPIYIAYSISHCDVDITFYMNKKEIELTSGLFELINEKPGDFYFLVEEKSAEKEDYLNALENIFMDFSIKSNVSVNRYKKIVSLMQAWYDSLPKSSKDDFIIDLDNDFKFDTKGLRRLLMRVNINSRELLLEELPELFHGLIDVEKKLPLIKNILDGKINDLRNSVEKELRQIFGFKETNSLKASLKDWYASYYKNIRLMTFSTKTNSFLGILDDIDNYTNDSLLNKISYITTGMFLEDWNNGYLEIYGKSLAEIIKEVENCISLDNHRNCKIVIQYEDKVTFEKVFDKKIGGNIEYLSNELEDVLEQYGESVNAEAKISILADLIQKVIKN